MHRGPSREHPNDTEPVSRPLTIPVSAHKPVSASALLSAIWRPGVPLPMPVLLKHSSISQHEHKKAVYQPPNLCIIIFSSKLTSLYLCDVKLTSLDERAIHVRAVGRVETDKNGHTPDIHKTRLLRGPLLNFFLNGGASSGIRFTEMMWERDDEGGSKQKRSW